ncbi:MAG TPA: ABC transporter ATP-binding protein [Chloroflexota bacterium]|nr:ABC transporter ATP-binding protein [Chloroflexota bacterium]
MIERIVEPAVTLRGLYKRFQPEGISPWRRFWPGSDGPPRGLVALDYVDLEVQRGEIFGVLGANGSGKSTLIRLVATLLLPDDGEIRVFGHDAVAEEIAVKRMMNRVSVEAAFFKKLSPMENLLYAARLYDLDPGAARLRIVEILGGLGINEKRVFEPLEHMSRGMQQKVAIARALLTSPVLLLLDEPTTGLDPRSKREVQEFVLQMREQHDTTVVLTTHDMEEADRLCDRIAMIADGRIIAQDTPAGLKRLLSPDGNVSLEDVFMELTGHGLEDEPAEDARILIANTT